MKNYTKQAWYFPNWHVTPQNELWHGKGWTEWRVTQHATPRFEGHLQPKIPLWGYGDESDPAVFEKKIRAAKDHGIDGFIFDFYWFKDIGPYRIDCLNRGFLGAESNEELEFSVMWANHDPICVHPSTFRSNDKRLASGEIDEELFLEVTDYCIKNYFPRRNYRRIDGKCYFGIWDMIKFANGVGGFEKAGALIRNFKERARASGFDVHFATLMNSMPHFFDRKASSNIPELKKDRELCKRTADTLGTDSLFIYSWEMPESRDWPKVEYSEFRELNVKRYREWSEFSPISLDITVSTGWDASPRTVQSDVYDPRGYGMSCITVGNTPDEVEKSFREARMFAESELFCGNTVTVSTWNEWTEGNYMEPDELYGYGYLEAFKKVFEDEN